MRNQMLSSWFVKELSKVTQDMWVRGWDERNGGNISIRLSDEDVGFYQQEFYQRPVLFPLNMKIPEVSGSWFLVTGSGKFFKNVQADPESNIGLIKINTEGNGYYVHWGFQHGGSPTSELPTHLQSHASRKLATQNQDKVIMHCHATNFMALSYRFKFNSAEFTRLLWEGSTECLVVFPDGVGVLPWMVPGTQEIGLETSKQMSNHSIVMWPFHGIFASGSSIDETFGLIETAEKSSEVIVKIMSMGGFKQSITTNQLIDLGKRFAVAPWEKALNVNLMAYII